MDRDSFKNKTKIRQKETLKKDKKQLKKYDTYVLNQGNKKN